MATPTASEKKDTGLPAKTGSGAPTSAKKPQDTLAMNARTIVDLVADKIHGFLTSGQLHLPKDYSVENALKSAWLALQNVEDREGNKALTVCTRDSIANSLLDMIVQGLNPGKKQLYFIVYAKTLTCQRSYFGSMAVAQMVNPQIGEFAYAVVYEGDTFKYGIQNGKKTVSLHEQDIANVDKKKIIAAYCIALDKQGAPMRTEIMTIEEIKQAWRQSKAKPFDDKGEIKADSTHGKFTADMALKTVINKTCKVVINASSDNALLLERINRNEDLADSAAAQAEIADHANKGELVEIPAETLAPGPGSVPADVAPEREAPQQVSCVCEQMTQDGMKEFDCPLHGRYQGGEFTPHAASPGLFDQKPQGRKPTF